jgi:hypothetical protein
MKHKKPRLGRPYKSPDLGPRLPVSYRIPAATVKKVREYAKKGKCSQGDVIVAAVDRLP